MNAYCFFLSNGTLFGYMKSDDISQKIAIEAARNANLSLELCDTPEGKFAAKGMCLVTGDERFAGKEINFFVSKVFENLVQLIKELKEILTCDTAPTLLQVIVPIIVILALIVLAASCSYYKNKNSASNSRLLQQPTESTPLHEQREFSLNI